MTRLRTDLPLIPDQEMKDWVQDIVENTHYRDVETLRLKLDEAIKSHNSELDEQSYTSAN
jgi:hypothetical protein